MDPLNGQPTPHILYEDNHILVAVKRPGILSQADGSPAPDMLSLLKEDIRQRYQKPGRVFLGLVHRLDQPVGGVMVFARTTKAASRLGAQIREQRFTKYYLAVVQSQPVPPCGRLEDVLVKDHRLNRVSIDPTGSGQKAWLAYAVASVDEPSGLHLLAIRLGTGRPHQIRVQMASRGWPICGDRRYGPDANGLRRDPAGRDRPTASGNRAGQDLALFACTLGFMHPTRQEPLLFSIKPPDESPWNCFPDFDVQSLNQLFTEC